MARAALGWTVRDLAAATGLHRNTITNIEIGRYTGDPKTLEIIETVLTRAGVQFIYEGGGPGVRFVEILSIQRASFNRNSIISEGAQSITTRQVKAARALLGWSQADLAERSGVSEATVARLESVDGELGGRGLTIEKIRAAIEAAGIALIEPDGGGPGVRLRDPKTNRSGARGNLEAGIHKPPECGCSTDAGRDRR